VNSIGRSDDGSAFFSSRLNSASRFESQEGKTLLNKVGQFFVSNNDQTKKRLANQRANITPVKKPSQKAQDNSAKGVFLGSSFGMLKNMC